MKDQWHPIATAPEDDRLHVRGLYVYSYSNAHPPLWEAICGRLDDDGDFVDHDGSAPWRADDYTHWMPLPEPPK